MHVGLDLRGDLDLVAVERDALQVRQKILLGGALRALVGDLAGQLVQLGARLGDLLGRIDHVHGSLEGAASTVG